MPVSVNLTGTQTAPQGLDPESDETVITLPGDESQPVPGNWLESLRQNMPAWIPTALLLVAGSCVFVVIIALIATRKKGGRQ